MLNTTMKVYYSAVIAALLLSAIVPSKADSFRVSNSKFSLIEPEEHDLTPVSAAYLLLQNTKLLTYLAS